MRFYVEFMTKSLQFSLKVNEIHRKKNHRSKYLMYMDVIQYNQFFKLLKLNSIFFSFEVVKKIVVIAIKTRKKIKIMVLHRAKKKSQRIK